MGDSLEDLYDRADDFWASKINEECAIGAHDPEFWKTQDGRMIHVSNLTDNHLKNIIKRFGFQSLPQQVQDEAVKRGLKS